ncbi:MAG: hypothetical protein KBT10_09920, partial [Bacteroidales bacterium]|nr:hypothetical protein [Candidatus Sodaliphilus aphodohippi]
MNRYYLLLLLAIISCFFVSCQSEEEQRMEVAQIVQSRPTQDLLNELYLASDGEIESLARILQVTPSSIERIRKGETEATTQFDDKIRSIVTYYYQNDRKFSLLQSALDDEYSWYDSVLNFP